MAVVKLICCLAIVVGCGFAGFSKSALIYERLELLKDFKQCLCNLQISMEYAATPMAKGLSTCVFLGCRQGVAAFFKAVAAAAEQGSGDMGEIWREEFSKNAELAPLTQQDRELFLSFAKNLGTTAFSGQKQNFVEIDRRLSHRIETLQPETDKKSRMYRSVGILGGLALAVVLI
ncbi:MAG: stage III sporulation protein AB [Christensenellales bacterium]|jgi:stage III sporulation protein AB